MLLFCSYSLMVIQVYMPRTHIQCVICSTSLPLNELPDHRYFCSGADGNVESGQDARDEQDDGRSGNDNESGPRDETGDGQDNGEAHNTEEHGGSGLDNHDVSSTANGSSNSDDPSLPRTGFEEVYVYLVLDHILSIGR